MIITQRLREEEWKCCTFLVLHVMWYNMKIDSASLKIYAVISGPCKKTQRGYR